MKKGSAKQTVSLSARAIHPEAALWLEHMAHLLDTSGYGRAPLLLVAGFALQGLTLQCCDIQLGWFFCWCCSLGLPLEMLNGIATQGGREKQQPLDELRRDGSEFEIELLQLKRAFRVEAAVCLKEGRLLESLNCRGKCSCLAPI